MHRFFTFDPYSLFYNSKFLKSFLVSLVFHVDTADDAIDADTADLSACQKYRWSDGFSALYSRSQKSYFWQRGFFTPLGVLLNMWLPCTILWYKRCWFQFYNNPYIWFTNIMAFTYTLLCHKNLHALKRNRKIVRGGWRFLPKEMKSACC